MKKILLLLVVLLSITGCTSKSCNCKDLDTKDKLVLPKTSKLNIKMTGLNEGTITADDIKSLKFYKFTIKENNPLYQESNLYVGVPLLSILGQKKVKVNFEYIYFKNSDSYTKLSINNITKTSFIVFYKNGVELEKPMFIKAGTSDIYWVNDIDEMSFTRES